MSHQYSIPLADLDNVIPEGALRTKYAYTYYNEADELVEVAAPTWRQALSRLNSRFDAVRRSHEGTTYVMICDEFKNLNGEAAHAMSLGDGLTAPAYTLFTKSEYLSFNWD